MSVVILTPHEALVTGLVVIGFTLALLVGLVIKDVWFP